MPAHGAAAERGRASAAVRGGASRRAPAAHTPTCDARSGHAAARRVVGLRARRGRAARAHHRSGGRTTGRAASVRRRRQSRKQRSSSRTTACPGFLNRKVPVSRVVACQAGVRRRRALPAPLAEGSPAKTPPPARAGARVSGARAGARHGKKEPAWPCRGALARLMPSQSVRVGRTCGRSRPSPSAHIRAAAPRRVAARARRAGRAACPAQGGLCSLPGHANSTTV
jgi:hypothetical protein